MSKLNPKKNYKATMKAIGYVERKKATLKDYKRIGFKSGLEVHQQLKTKSKLFCRCPAGIFHDDDDFNAEVIRHMRPTLSELGEYDGTALMEFKTRKEIIYRLNNENACTYEVDDTPPFPIDKEALESALEISLLSKLNIVGEVHITRKQYLDGSIPTGFQRTAILGVEGEIQLKKKKVRLIQLSIEEDSCREISDVGHRRVYKTDRLGMPLIETVTYPEMETPDELVEAAEYIRFLNRSTGKVRTGSGAGREDVNVSCAGGSRVEIKGVSYNKNIPILSHNEAFRQYALLNIKKLIKKKKLQKANMIISHAEIDFSHTDLMSKVIKDVLDLGYTVKAINIPGFKGILSHFLQPGRTFSDEIVNRLKVIACIEKPNMTHSEELEPVLSDSEIQKIAKLLEAEEGDAQIIVWGPKEDIPTALETIEERILMAFDGVPEETRKSLADGTTIFERVLPGSDRMYPDTDSAPIPLTTDYIESLRKDLPIDISVRYKQMEKWEIPEDTHKYLLSKNMIILIERINKDFGFKPKFLGCFIGHTFKNIEGKKPHHKKFTYNKIFGLFKFIKENNLEPDIAKYMIQDIYDHPEMDLNSVLTGISFKKRNKNEIMAPIDFLNEKFKEIRTTDFESADINWLMGQVHKQARGNIALSSLRKEIEIKIRK